MFATDLDGTLFDHTGRVPEGTQEAIRKAAERGVYVVLCSGRSPSEGVAALGESLGLNRPGNYYICCSGALVVDAADLRILAGNYLPKPAAAELYAGAKEIFREIGPAEIRLHTNRQVYLSNWAERDREYEKKSGVTFLPLPEDFSQLEGDITKLLFLNWEPGYAAGFFRRMAPFLPKEAIGYEMPPALAEYTGASANKGAAVRQLAELLGISMEEVVCAGDGYNDISMLKAAGLGIAMQNAYPEVKAAADLVLPETNDENGVEKILSSFF